MFNRLINGGMDQELYGVAPMYGVPRDTIIKNIMQYFFAFLFVILIPAILLVGVLAFAKKKQFSKKEKSWAAVIVLGIYFVTLAGITLTVIYLIN